MPDGIVSVDGEEHMVISSRLPRSGVKPAC